MAKLTLQDLANVLVEKNGLSKQEALQFVTAIFEAVQDGLQKEKLVKIKGLGTFKVIEVEARESVNVNTGERVIISSHQKITFTPDAAMKELVNKPFSGFETVVLNEGVNFDDMMATAPVTAENNEHVAEEEPLQTVAPQQPVSKLNYAADVAVADTQPQSAGVEEEQFNDYGMTPKAPERKWLWPVLIVLACGACFFGGYKMSNVIDPMRYYQNIDTIMPNDSLETGADSIAMTTGKKDTVKVAPAKTKADTIDYRQYEEMDIRVKTGAYRIVGTDRVIKTTPGETLGYIAGRVLGPDMVCYLEVYNGIKESNKALEAGTEIKIPKLELKKKKKKAETNN